MENVLTVNEVQANANVELVELGKTLMNAARTGDVQTVIRLVQYGAPFATDWLGMTALHHAALRGHRDMVDVLLRSGIAKEPRSKVDKTPLHLACQEGHTEVARHLINNGAEIDAFDMINMTPLHWAVQMNHVQTAHLLLLSGADPFLTNKFEKNCFDIAESVKNNKMLTLFKEAKKISRGARMKLKLSRTVETGGKKIYVKCASPLKQVPKSTVKKKTVIPKDAENEEVWQYLEDHGIEMLEGEDVNLVVAAIGSGQSVYVTEAGKQALNLTEEPIPDVVEPHEFVNNVQNEAVQKSTNPKRSTLPDKDSWDYFIKINNKYSMAQKAAKRYRALYLKQKQTALMYKKELSVVFKAVNSVDKLEGELVIDDEDMDDEDDEDDEEEDDELLDEDEEDMDQDVELLL